MGLHKLWLTSVLGERSDVAVQVRGWMEPKHRSTATASLAGDGKVTLALCHSCRFPLLVVQCTAVHSHCYYQFLKFLSTLANCASSPTGCQCKRESQNLLHWQ